ncbi:MAG: alpha/beta hydrolase [Clostridiales bacterium]|nr:alpha/beta hydrolase [Clostridiales bacterium]
MFNKLKPIFVILIATIIVVVTIPFKSVVLQFVSAMLHNRDYILDIGTISPNVKYVTCDPKNKIFLLITVRDFRGNVVPRARVDLNVRDGVGTVSQKHVVTDGNGECIVTYIPPSITDDSVSPLFEGQDLDALVCAKLYKGKKEKQLKFGIRRIPIVYVHGYQENKDIFNSMSNYFEEKGYIGEFFSYDSSQKVENNAKDIAKFLEELKMKYLNEGLKVKSFDVVCHSMGGLVVRYYTCSSLYWEANDINKIVFISTPHKGSPVAQIGISLYDDDGVKDLEPEGELIGEKFPSMFNKGLNNKIETLNMLGQYDEVVAFDAASLDEWGIKTELYNVGENNLTINSLLDGSFISAENHKNILSNMKVFKRIEEFLNRREKTPIYLKQK